MAMCAIGSHRIDGAVDRVFTAQHPDGIDVCRPHALVYRFGNELADALAAELGEDHPYVERAATALDDLFDVPCPHREEPPRVVGDLPAASEIPPCPGVAA